MEFSTIRGTSAALAFGVLMLGASGNALAAFHEAL